MDWSRILASVTGTVDQELLARNEYLAAENRIMKAQLNGRPKLSDVERGVLDEIGHRLGRTVLADVVTVARPDTIFGWYRKLAAHKFYGSLARQYPGRLWIKREAEELMIRMASENRDWGYVWFARGRGALAICSSAPLVARRPRSGASTPASAIRRQAGRCHVASSPRSNGCPYRKLHPLA